MPKSTASWARHKLIVAKEKKRSKISAWKEIISEPIRIEKKPAIPNNNLLFLHTNMDTGHGGASGRFDALKEVARDYSFLFDLEGIDK